MRILFQQYVNRLTWRIDKNNSRRVSIFTQFFSPDYAATGQFLDDLTRRIASPHLQFQIFTGMPSYAFDQSSAQRVEFRDNILIRRTNASRFWPNRIRGRAVNGIGEKNCC